MKSRLEKDSLLAIAFVLGLYFLAIAIVRPFGDFPLNDDWAFAKAVKIFVETGSIKLTSWIRMSFLAQLFYGSSFVWIFGFSHLVLRISTMLLGAFTLVLFFALLRLAGISASRSALGCVVLVSNPFFMGNSFTFMTQIPFLFATIAAVLMFAKALDEDRLWLVLAAGAFASLAVLVRQNGILLPIAAVVAVVWNGKRSKSDWVKIALFCLFPVAALTFFEIWLQHIHGPLPETWEVRGFAGPVLFLKHLVEIPIVSIFYMGLLLLPIVIPFGIVQRKQWRPKGAPIVGIVAFAFLLVFAMARGIDWFRVPLGWKKLSLLSAEWMPYLGNSWFCMQTFGQGPYTLRDVFLLGNTGAVAYPSVVFHVATLISAITGAALVALIWDGYSKMREAPFIVKLMIALALLNAAFLVVLDFYVDRYLLILFPSAILLLLFMLDDRPLVRMPVIACAALLYMVTVASVYHYHRWNEARWAAIDYLEKDVGASPTEIDGGFEYNGWMLFDDYYRPKKGKSWWWVTDDKYIIAFSKIRGYKIKKSFPIRSFVPGVTREILALEREADGTIDNVNGQY